ncbi:hypothetical protein C1H76_3751 [Elsinoe australis]|uniref:DUF7025 domain-containing protein n=1 Tax=Elsinoe australis TaxID=40998 RepID=A0A4U7AYS5_9PEZI|nr:hypothetical protein C1H76_3751 [Elsinoe australis]
MELGRPFLEGRVSADRGLEETLRPYKRKRSSSACSSSDNNDNTPPEQFYLAMPATSKHIEFGMAPSCKEYYRHKDTSPWKPWTPGQEEATRVAMDEVQQHALVVRREKDTEGLTGIKLHSIEVQSPLIKEVLDKTFVGYRGLSTKLTPLKFKAPFDEFVHRWDQLNEAASQDTDEVVKQHIALLRGVLDPEVLPLVERTRNLISNGLIAYDDLWALYEPGTFAYSREHNMDRAFLVGQTSFVGAEELRCFVIHALHVDSDGQVCGTVTSRSRIRAFKGTVAILDQSIVPLHWKPDAADIRSRLISRGKEWQSFNGAHHMSYTGIYLRPVKPKLSVKEYVMH